MARSVSAKLGIKAGARAIVVDAPGSARAAIDPPDLDVAPSLSGAFDPTVGRAFDVEMTIADSILPARERAAGAVQRAAEEIGS